MKRSANILVIVADQLAARALPAYGNAFPTTPNLNRLAARGVRFERAYTPCPLCQPARAAIWSGLYPHRTGVQSNGRNFPVAPLPETLPTLGSIFEAGGYRTIHFGKSHDAGALRGFEIVPEGSIQVEGHPAWPVNADTFKDRHTAIAATEFIRDYREDQPYLAVVDFNNPHNICGWVGENIGPHVDVPVPGELPPILDNFSDPPPNDRPLPVRYLCCSHRRQAQTAGWNESNYRHYLAAYCHYIERVDAEIGLVLDAGESRSDADNTYVVFLSDHGDGMGAHGIVTKHTGFYEESTHVPLIVAGPEVNRGRTGARTPLISLLDLTPTLCDLAGLEPSADMSGRSFKAFLQEERADPIHRYVVSEWHTEWGFTIEPGRMVRSEKFKYTCYREENGEELYDLETDPGETRNLAKDAQGEVELQIHRDLLVRHVEETGDPFFELKPVVDPRWRSHPAGYEHHRGPSAPEV